MKKVFILILVYLFSFSAWSGELHKAVKSNDIETFARELIKAGVGVDLQDKEGMTPLHWASFLGSIEGSTEIVALLINNGAKVNAKDKDGMTPLHWASLSGNLDLTEIQNSSLEHLERRIRARLRHYSDTLNLSSPRERLRLIDLFFAGFEDEFYKFMDLIIDDLEIIGL